MGTVARRGGPRRPLSAAALALAGAVWALPALSAGGQNGRTPRPALDPYTGGASEALRAAGLVSLGPFRVGDGLVTTRVEEDLGGVPLLWAETAHFLLGCSLDEYSVSEDAGERRKLRAELTRLSERVPGVRPRAQELDPWLRLHLWAQRLEELYADFCGALGVGEGDFSDEGKPYLGMRGKFRVLLFEKQSSQSRFSALYLGGPEERPERHWFPEADALLYCANTELLQGSFDNDTAFHCAVAYGVAQNLVSGFGGYGHEAPVWLNMGLPRWLVRRIEPRWQVYAGPENEAAREADEADWEPKVRARVEHRYFPSTREMLAWTDPGALSFADHMIAWSRVDCILRREEGAALALLRALSEPVPWDDKREERLAQQFERAFVEALGEPQAFDERWCAWVRSEYPKR